jgi:LEA14-like dessication related protein
MKRRELIRLGVASSVLVPTAGLSTGCATLWDLLGNYIKAPKLDVKKMELMGMSLTSIAVKFHTLISNPNPFGFRLDGLDYLLKVAGGQLAKGSAPQGITLKPSGSATSELDLEFDLGKTAAAILELVTKKSADYELQAVGKFFSKQGGINVPFGHKGVMPMPTLPKISVRSFEPTSVSTSAVAFAVTTSVENNMAFDIPIDGFEFDVKVDGRRILQNKSTKGLKLQANKSNLVPFEFRVGLGELGVTVAELATGKRMNWELLTELKSGPLVAPFTNRGSFRLGS